MLTLPIWKSTNSNQSQCLTKLLQELPHLGKMQWQVLGTLPGQPSIGSSQLISWARWLLRWSGSCMQNDRSLQPSPQSQSPTCVLFTITFTCSTNTAHKSKAMQRKSISISYFTSPSLPPTVHFYRFEEPGAKIQTGAFFACALYTVCDVCTWVPCKVQLQA